MGVSLTALLGPVPASRAAPRQDRFFGEQVSVHPESYPSGLYVIPPGDFVLTGEGGTIAVLDARLEPGNRSSGSCTWVSPGSGSRCIERIVDGGGGVTFPRIDVIQTPGEAEGLWIRRPAGGAPTLWVANTYGGIRAFGFAQ